MGKFADTGKSSIVSAQSGRLLAEASADGDHVAAMTAASRPPIIIAGMHRSGTTLLARMLMRCGVFLGWRRESNEESRTFLEVNKWLLLQAGGSWDFPPPADQFADPVSQRLCTRFMRYALNSPWFSFYLGRPWWRRGTEAPRFDMPWGWKDPRNSITLPLWARVYPDAYVIHLRRHGVDVAASLLARHQRRMQRWEQGFEQRKHFFWLRLRKRRFETGLGSLDAGFALWERYQDMTLAAAPLFGQRFLSIRYEDLLLEPAATLRTVCDRLEIDASVPEDALRLPQAGRAYAHRDDPALVDFSRRHGPALAAAGYEFETSTSPRAG